MTTTQTCAHYCDGISNPEAGIFSVQAGACLFGERNWSRACAPKRCSNCPNLNPAARGMELAQPPLTREMVREKLASAIIDTVGLVFMGQDLSDLTTRLHAALTGATK